MSAVKNPKNDPCKDPRFEAVACVVQTIAAATESKKTASNLQTYTRHVARILFKEAAADTSRSYAEILAHPDRIHAIFSTEAEEETSDNLGRRHRDAKNAQKRSPSSRNQLLWWLRAVIPRLVVEEVLPAQAEKRLSTIKKAATPEQDRFQPSAQQVRELLEEMKKEDPRLALFIRFLAVTGLRFGGALSLRWDRIDWDTNLMRAVVTKGRCVAIPMLLEAREILLRLKEENPFHKRAGTIHCWPLGSTRRKKVNRLLKAGPSGCTHAHALRHWFTHAAKKAGMPIPVIALILGHRDGGKTLLEYYSHEDPQKVAREWGHLKLLDNQAASTKANAAGTGTPAEALIKALLKALGKQQPDDQAA